MRVLSKDRNHFRGTHKGALIEIEHEKDGRFYIQVRHKDGGYMYDGWAPAHVRQMRHAKAEAIRGACLDEIKSGAWKYFHYANILSEAKVRLAEARGHPTKWSADCRENTIEYWCAWVAHANAASVFGASG